MKWTALPLSAMLAATLGLGVGSAQQPPSPRVGSTPSPAMAAPPPPPDPNSLPPTRAAGPPALLASTDYTRRGTIRAFNAGPNGETNGLILGDGTVILFPPEMGEQFRSSVRQGSRITVSGRSRSGPSGRLVVNAQTITANGQTFTVPVASPGAPAGPHALTGPPPPPNGAPSLLGRGIRNPRPQPPPPPAAGPLPGRQPAPPDAL